MKKVKLYIELLQQLELTSTEKFLLEVNLQLMGVKHKKAAQVGAKGIMTLMNQVHFRLAMRALLEGINVLIA